MELTENLCQGEGHRPGGLARVLDGEFPCTRLAGVVQPDQQKPMVDLALMRTLGPTGVRDLIGDGNFGGSYQRSDDDMNAVWSVAVEETRQLIHTL